MAEKKHSNCNYTLGVHALILNYEADCLNLKKPWILALGCSFKIFPLNRKEGSYSKGALVRKLLSCTDLGEVNLNRLEKY